MTRLTRHQSLLCGFTYKILIHRGHYRGNEKVLIHVCASVLGDDVVLCVGLEPRHTVAHQA
jgi:hypothetical protein